jgi:kumamolisin
LRLQLTILNIAALSLLATACSGPGANSAIPAASEAGAVSSPLGSSDSSANRAGDIVADAAPLGSVSARDLGHASPKTILHLAITLQYRNQPELDRLVADQQRPGSAAYHAWLTDDEFLSRFAPLQADYARVATSLRNAGLRVERTFPNRTVLDAVGTVARVEAYFGTRIDVVNQRGHGQQFANVVAAHAPADLKGAILDVSGLSSLVLVSPLHALVTPGNAARSMPAPDAKAAKLFGPPSTSTGAEGYAPLAFWAGYDLPVSHAGGKNGHYDGAGHAVGVVIDADFVNSDITAFLKYFAITRKGKTTRVVIAGGPPPGDEGTDSVEATLDTETISAEAPGSNLYVYEVPSLSSANIVDAYNKVVSDNEVDVASSSFGGCEAFLGTAVNAWSKIAEQGLAKGITFTAASGDGGGLLCAMSPASSPYVVAVGGTALGVGPSGAWASEIAWSGSGGGVSSAFALPAWQNGVAGINARGRNYPDVALDADPYSGTAFYYTGTWNNVDNPIGGTSLASPLYASAVAEIDEVKGARVGLSSAKLFGQWAASGYGTTTPIFHDITQGSNGIYAAQPGYDLVTGIGSIDAWNLANAL